MEGVGLNAPVLLGAGSVAQGQTGLRNSPLDFRRPIQPGNALEQADLSRGAGPWGPQLSSTLPTPLGPPAWAEVAQEAAATGDLILLLFASARLPGDPARSPSKKLSPAPGDCDHPGAGAGGARPGHHWAAGGDPSPLGFLPASPNVIVAPRNNGSVCLSAAGGSVQLLGWLFLALSDQR